MSAPGKPYIVALDSWVEPPKLSFEYDSETYPSTTPEQLPERMKNATIVIVSGTKVTRKGIESAPKLQLVACNGTGTDHIDKVALRDHGVSLCHVPAQNTDSVSEHAFALYYSLRRRIMQMHHAVADGTSWPGDNHVYRRLGRPPRTNSEETLVVIGYGALGQY